MRKREIEKLLKQAVAEALGLTASRGPASELSRLAPPKSQSRSPRVGEPPRAAA